MVRWRRVNLLDDLSRVGQFELILCRNTLGQLAPDAQARVASSLRRALAPGGRLVVGDRDPVDSRLTPVAPELGLYAAGAEPARSAA
jgi:chemotaxis protein methyltransferase CheR